MLTLRIGSCPFQYFVKQEDGPIACFAIRDSSLADHLVNCSCFDPQQLSEFLHIKKLWTRLVYAVLSCTHCNTSELVKNRTCRAELASMTFNPRTAVTHSYIDIRDNKWTDGLFEVIGEPNERVLTDYANLVYVI